MIFYLSGTGNTHWVAEQLAEMTGNRLIDIAKELDGPCRYELQENESVGFCFPIHAWRPPMLMRRFISQLTLVGPNDHKPYCWSVFTMGDSAGLAADYLQQDLAERQSHCEGDIVGFQAQLVASVAMPNTYVGMPGMDVDAEELAEKKKKAAAKRVPILAERIKNHEQGVDVVRGKFPWFTSKVIGSGFVKGAIDDKAFHVTESCIRCGQCASACPVDNIEFTEGSTPQWKHNRLCMTCFACYHRCPKHAIAYGNRTKNKGQYRFCC